MTKRIAAIAVGVALLGAAVLGLAPVARAEAADTAAEFVKELRIGWNLGNALDSTDYKKQGILTELGERNACEVYETLWGNPVTTRSMIEAVAQAGFGAVRVPVTFYDHMDDSFRINEEWLKRVEEVAGYVLDSGMRCIINLHHDAGKGTWLKADPARLPQMKANMETVWRQIALHFSDYDERLLFEGFNEILDADDRWTNAGAEVYRAVNELNQTFVDTVRAAGGNNAARYLIVKTYAAGVAKDMLEAFALPVDSAHDRLIVGVHTYMPPPFTALRDEGDDNANALSGSTFYEILDRLDSLFIQSGTPVIIAEFCARNKNNTAERVDYAKDFVETAAQYGIACFWWDDGGRSKPPEEVTNSALLNRAEGEWHFPLIVAALVESASFPQAKADGTPPAQSAHGMPGNAPSAGLAGVDRLALLIVFGLSALLALNLAATAAVRLGKRCRIRRGG